MSANRAKPALLVLTSTFPRWANDTEPRFVFDLCLQLVDHFEIHVLAPHIAGAQPVERFNNIRIRRFRYFVSRWESLTYEGGIINRLRQNPMRYALIPLFLGAQIIATRRLLRSRSFDVIHAHWLIPQGLTAVLAQLGQSKIPVVCTSHGGDLYGLQQPIFTLIKRWILRRCSAITVVSSAMQKEVRLISKKANAEVISMGTDLTTLFTPDPTVTRRPKTLLFVGRLVEKKGIPHLIEAFATVRKTHLEAELWIVGAGPDKDALEKQARTLNIAQAVRFIGPVEHRDLPKFYREATIAVVPSIVAKSGDQEGLGLVIVEALGCGCPVVASGLPAIHDVVQDGVTGLLARPGNPCDLAKRIDTLLTNPGLCAQLGTAGRHFVLSHFDWSVTQHLYFKLLSSLCHTYPSIEKP